MPGLYQWLDRWRPQVVMPKRIRKKILQKITHQVFILQSGQLAAQTMWLAFSFGMKLSEKPG
jgi:hypothetical protein